MAKPAVSITKCSTGEGINKFFYLYVVKDDEEIDDPEELLRSLGLNYDDLIENLKEGECLYH